MAETGLQSAGQASNETLLARIDERTQSTLREVENVRAEITSLRQEISSTYVTKAEFMPVQMVTFGLVGVILLAVIGALMARVIKAERREK